VPDAGRFIGHGGGAPGMSGSLQHFLNSGVTVIVLANRDPRPPPKASRCSPRTDCPPIEPMSALRPLRRGPDTAPDRDVELVVSAQLGGDVEHDRRRPRLLMIFVKAREKPAIGEGGDAGDPQARPGGTAIRDSPAQDAERLTNALAQRRAGLGQGKLGAMAPEQRDSKPLLEVADPLTDRGGCD
jgi:hypothetical protein